LIALELVVAGCGTTGPDFEEDGVVRFVDVGGGCWVIEVGETRFEPINLTEEFRTDGLLVSFEAKDRTDLASYCMVGRIVELSSIRVRDG
jgi:hypothetical protein